MVATARPIDPDDSVLGQPAIQPAAPQYPPPPSVPYATPGAYQQPWYPPPVQTVEKTGKFWKAQMLLAAMMTIVGVIMVCAGVQSMQATRAAGGQVHASGGIGGLLVFGGLIWFIVARVLAWWNHG